VSHAASKPEELGDLINRYHAWLRDRTVIKQIRQWTEITTPFLDRHNDCLQVYAKREDDGGYLLTDDSYILHDLEISGCNLDSPKRRELLQTTLNGFGVKLVDRSLQVSATVDNFPLRKHNLIQAMLAVNDLFYLASSTVQNLFFEDVAAWLDESGVRYIPHIKLPGLSNFDHVFDFAIPKSAHSPERLLRAITNPNRENAQNFAFAWLDTKPARAPNSVAYAVLNDNERPLNTTVLDALSAYGINSVPWTQRANSVEALVA
jgi:hypothetical protein